MHQFTLTPHCIICYSRQTHIAVAALHRFLLVQRLFLTPVIHVTPPLFALVTALYPSFAVFLAYPLRCGFDVWVVRLNAHILTRLLRVCDHQERTKDNSKESESFRELLAVRTAEYVEETLSPHFGALMQFVRDAEAMVERGDSEALKREERRITDLVRSFAAGWKKSLEEINNEIMRSFTNFRNGTNILQDALKQLILYYNRFQKILGLQVLKSLPARGEAINIHHIMVEVKKYKPNF